MPILLKHWGRMQPQQPTGANDRELPSLRRPGDGPRSTPVACSQHRRRQAAPPPPLAGRTPLSHWDDEPGTARRAGHLLWHDSTLTLVNASLLSPELSEREGPTTAAMASVSVLVEPHSRYYYLEVSDADWVEDAPNALGRCLPLFRDAGVWISAVQAPWHGVRAATWPEVCHMHGLQYVDRPGWHRPPSRSVVETVLRTWAPLLHQGHSQH